MDKIWLYCWPLLWLWEIFLKIFFMWTIFKVFTEFITILRLFYILVFWPQGMWDLSSLTRDWTSCMKGEVLNRWIFRQVPGEIVLFPSWNFILLIHSIEFIINISWETSVQFSSVAQLCPTLCWPHERQQARHPCPSPTPEVYTNSCPLSQWCHPAISFSVIPFSSAPNPSKHQGLFQWVNSLHEVAKVLEFQLQHQSFQWTPRTDML